MRYYVWQFKESPQQAAFALDDYIQRLSTWQTTEDTFKLWHVHNLLQ
jgi:hypothetical protein